MKGESVLDLKRKMLDFAFKNQYIVDSLMRKDNKANNERILEWKKIFSGIDSIQEIDRFIQTVVLYKQEKDRPQYYMCEGKESLLYGHAKMLYDYAGIKFKKPVYLAKIEHGINFYESASVFDLSIKPACYIFQGNYKRQIAKKKDSTMPIFTIGPYIHYARDYYSDGEFMLLKQKIGKVLLIFPAHTYELSQCEYDAQKFVNDVYEQYGCKYETVMVCAYWLDADSLVYSLFREKGAMIVSAGARFDDEFISRLKSIICLSDAVLVNDIGTNIGYAIYLGKPVYMLSVTAQKNDEACDDMQELAVYKKNEKAFHEAFENCDEDKIIELYQYFWGGTACIKTPAEMRKIIRYAEKKVRRMLGNSAMYRFYWAKLKGMEDEE